MQGAAGHVISEFIAVDWLIGCKRPPRAPRLRRKGGEGVQCIPGQDSSQGMYTIQHVSQWHFLGQNVLSCIVIGSLLLGCNEPGHPFPLTQEYSAANPGDVTAIGFLVHFWQRLSKMEPQALSLRGDFTSGCYRSNLSFETRPSLL